ncbi:MAG: hypothetical protein Q4C77_03060 [Eubacteriales bacterium]|nr:hypothetical protein [Eubacteriales bacterium]
MWGIPFDEDVYWERRREEWENPKAFCRRKPWDEDEPVYESGTLYLDEEIEEIEAKRGYPMSELYEGDLLEILEELKGIEAESAVWVPGFDAIDYKIKIA